MNERKLTELALSGLIWSYDIRMVTPIL